MWQQIIHYFSIIPGGFWSVLLASVPVSGFVAWVNKKWAVESPRVKFFLVALVSGLLVTANYILRTPVDNPSIIAIQTAVLGFMTQPAYVAFVKPLSQKIASNKAAAANIKLDVQSAVVPAGGIPNIPTMGPSMTANTPMGNSNTTVDDFSE